jgi:flagellar assembly factor FliW
MNLISTTRFGELRFDPGDLWTFPAGLIGFECWRHWVLLADSGHEHLAWLQSTERPDLAFAVTSPRWLEPDYRVRIASTELTPLGIEPARGLFVLVIVSAMGTSFSANFKAPLCVHPATRRGVQVVVKDDYPIQFPLSTPRQALRRSA